MKKSEFIIWLDGYLTGVPKDAKLEDILQIIQDKMKDLKEDFTPIVIKEIEKILPQHPFCPPLTPFQPIITMYGCGVGDWKPITCTNENNNSQ